MWKWFFPYYKKTNVDDDLHLRLAVVIVLAGMGLGLAILSYTIFWLVRHFI